MTNRHIAYTVLLEEPLREDDAQCVIDAISMIKGVHSVQPQVADAQTFWAKRTARSELVRDILDMVRKEDA